MTKARFYIFFRALLIVIFSTSNIYLISNHLYVAAIVISGGISTMWTLNIKDLAISDWYDRAAYILGGIIGTTISLYLLDIIIKKP